jgi:hypothetical protein
MLEIVQNKQNLAWAQVLEQQFARSASAALVDTDRAATR